jgi:hypothetical protein
MKRAAWEKLRKDAANCAYQKPGNHSNKRELFTMLANHLSALAHEVERAMLPAEPKAFDVPVADGDPRSIF